MLDRAKLRAALESAYTVECVQFEEGDLNHSVRFDPKDILYILNSLETHEAAERGDEDAVLLLSMGLTLAALSKDAPDA